ncbi:DUF1307 domain-containing protein [Macrococcus brunensis]|uniref:DUF1307 domain-containing protein n=1 Tax=Macrococcus brunensis TaxID=198483 RepID=UPI001EEFAF81|nr:DUF1307 domain-containing protein [Macrococcus brunensis]ULG74461.1 YehR family protein [Macrococcus brunensis]
MKNLFKSLAVVLVIIFLSACGNTDSKSSDDHKNESSTETTSTTTEEVTNEEKAAELTKKVFVQDDGMGTTSELTYWAEGDKVVKQETHNIMDLKKLGSTKEEAKQAMEAANQKYKKKLDGYKYDVKYTAKQVDEIISVDYNKVGINKIKDIMNSDGNTDRGISMNKSEEMLKEAGYKLKN